MAGPVGSAVGVLTGVAVGGAATTALDPAFEVPRQDAWSRNPNKILDVDLLARLVAQGGVDLSDAQSEALRDGFQSDKLDQLVYLAQTVPGVPEALLLWRRGLIGDDLFAHVIVKAGLDQRYAAPLQALKTAEIVGIGDLAYGVVRGILPAPSWVPVAPPTSGTTVPRFPQVPIDPIAEAAKLGFNEAQFQIMVGRSGLSLAPGLAATAFFRGLINAEDYLLAIAEGDLRTEWAQTLQDASRQVPTAGEFVEAWLRGWITQAEAEAGAAQHGMTPAHADLLYKIKGRPISFHEITTGLARGGTYPSDYTAIPEPYRKSAEEADLRPEWADLHYANRYTYPSAFVLRTLAQAGDLGDQASVEQILLEIGWKPSFAQQVSTAWLGGTGAADKHVAKAQTSLWTTTHRSYIAEEIDDATATTALTAAGVTVASIPAILALWQEERSLIRKQLTPTQIRKAVSGAVINPATGVAWTHADALAALLARGYSQADAETFLAE